MTIIMMRIAKIQTRSWIWMVWKSGPATAWFTASRMKVISATPVTP